MRRDAGDASLDATRDGRPAPSPVMLDGNTAAASVAYRMSEVIGLFPITPASPMGEHSDAWAAAHRTNVWGAVPRVVAMQSEAGAAGAVHGALSAGAMATTFTASQGLLLMIPDMLKIAGELTPFCMHVAARTLATHALSIFCDHSDVMAARTTGFALLASGSVQECADMAAIAHAATLRARVPFIHFFDGFRTSHEIAKVVPIEDATLRALVDEDAIARHRARALDPDRPTLRGTAQNPDTFFQAREASSPFYAACASIVVETMDRFAELTGRAYAPFEYEGAEEPDRVLVLMGSAAETASETADHLAASGERVGVLRVRLYRPFDEAAFIETLPASVRTLAVLDRTKEPGAVGDPLYLDVVAALARTRRTGPDGAPIRVVAGRYGLSSKELTPSMLASVYAELAKPEPRDGFTVGNVDDVMHTSLTWDRKLDLEETDVVRAVFFGLGSDGTVGANKQAITILGEGTDLHAQGFFVYDSKKSGTTTVSHLRVSPRPIRSAYLVGTADLVACSAPEILWRREVLELAKPEGTVLLNLPAARGAGDDPWDKLPSEAQDAIRSRKLRVFAVDAARISDECGLEGRVGTVMQTAFFALTSLLPREDALARVRAATRKAYGKHGDEVVAKNLRMIDLTLERLAPLEVPADVGSRHARPRPDPVPTVAPDFVRRVTARLLAGEGDKLPVSAFPPDGTWPVGTAQWEKRRLATEVPVWSVEGCIQCNKCTLACPHTALRAKIVDPRARAGVDDGVPSMPYKSKDVGAPFPGGTFTYLLAVSPDDCTGCGLCTAACPVDPKPLAMTAVEPVRAAAQAAFDVLVAAPSVEQARVRLDVKGSQLLDPHFEYPGACTGCGQTPYLKLLSQLFGDRAVIANATGCSSIYGGNLPTTPWSVDRDGRGPAWSNSLFEDDAEFGFGIRLGIEARRDEARRLVRDLAGSGVVPDSLAEALLCAESREAKGIAEQRERVAVLRGHLAAHAGDAATRSEVARAAVRLDALADALVRRSVWIVGGDGWAYDIGFGGLDHVLASGADVNVLVLDTEVYSNTGGQRSKATPLGAIAKFAQAGKETPKKDLGLMAITYGSVYVASIAMGARDAQAVKALVEAESFEGPSLVIASSPCIEHGYDIGRGPDHEKLAFSSGVLPLFRYDPRRAAAGEAPLQLETPTHPESIERYLRSEDRFARIARSEPERFASVVAAAEREVARRRDLYERLGAAPTHH